MLGTISLAKVHDWNDQRLCGSSTVGVLNGYVIKLPSKYFCIYP